MKKENSKIEKTKNSVSTSAFNNKFKPKLYFSFGFRLLINAVLFAFFGILCFVTASKTIEREKTTPIKYTDANQINYKVYLKENDLYSDNVLGMNRAYVASLIDHIDINYNYLFNIERITDMDFEHKVIAQLVIENSNGAKYIDEEYVLKDVKKDKVKNSGNINIDESVVIDYNYYNELANKFKNKTVVDVISYLNVYIQVDKKTNEKLNYNINEALRANVKIPLSERAIEINLVTDQGTVNKQVIPKGKVIFNPIYLFIEIILFLITCFFMLKLIKYLVTLLKKDTKYDKYIRKILKDYDRVIVETRTNPDLTDCKIVDVISFEELLDVRDNIKQPIIYLNIADHQKGMFYVKNNNDIYRFMIKDSDLKRQKKRKKH